MKKIILLIILTTFYIGVGQNLITNGDFEIGQVPNLRGQISLANGWSDNCTSPNTFTNGGTGIDLYDRNTSNSQIDVPNNMFGNLDERNGNNRYIHMLQIPGSSTNLQSEVLKGSLCNYLARGTYDLNFWVARPSNSAIDALSNDKQILEVYLVNNNNCNGKLIYTTQNITQLNWFQLNTSFVINSSENNLYNKILVKFKTFTTYTNQQVFLDGFELKKQCTNINIQLPNLYTLCGNTPNICAPLPPACESYTYYWGLQSSGLVLSQNQCFTPTQPGNYALTVINNNGCSSTTHNFTVTNQLPTVDLGHDIIICEGDYHNIPSINISNQGFDNGNFTITWYHNGNVVQNGGTVLQISPISGTISVVVSSPGCHSQIDQIEIITKVCCPEEVNIGLIMCPGQSPIFHILNQGYNLPGYNITWYFNGNVIQNGGEILQMSMYGNGIISVTVEKDGCENRVSDQISISCDKDVHPHHGKEKELKQSSINNLNIYPNPASDIINFIFDEDETGKVEIYSLEGKLVFSKDFREINQLEASLSDYQAGIYIARITIGEETITKKIIKE